MSIRQTKQSHTYVSHSQNTTYFAKNIPYNFWHNSIKFFWHFYYWDVDQSINVGIIFFSVGFFFAHLQFSWIFHKNIFLYLEPWSNYMVYVHSCWQKLVLSDIHIQNPWRRPLWVHAFVGAFRGVFHFFFLFVPGS